MTKYESGKFYFDLERQVWVTRGEILELTKSRANEINAKLGKDTVTTVKPPVLDLVYNPEDGTTSAITSVVPSDEDEAKDESDAAAETIETTDETPEN